MEKRKPNILLTVALGLLVLAAIVCLIIFLTSLGGNKSNDPVIESNNNETPTELSGSDDTSTDPSTPDQTQENNPAQPGTTGFDSAALQAELDDCLDGVTSTWQVCVVDVASGSAVISLANCTEDEKMIAADLPELFIMAAVYQQLADGKLAEDQVDTLLKEMIREDKDSASNELTKLLGSGDAAAGRAAVNAFAKSIGCERVEFNRLFGEAGTQNYVTAADCATLLYLIAKGECVSADASQKMHELMTGTPGERIPAGVADSSVVAHLNANITGSCCADAGIVTAANGEYVIVIVCNNPYTNEGSTKKCVELTKLVSAHFE